MIKEVKRIVVKVGTSSLTYQTGKLNIRRIRKLGEVLSDLLNSGVQVALVSSGAIGVGTSKLGLSARPTDTPGRQAAATVGQCELMFMYDKVFSEFGHTVGQLLITRSDVENDERRENLINCFEKLFEYGAIPIINENDTIATEEIVIGDNDTLGALVAKLVNADLLILLSDIEGLYSADPRTEKNAKLIDKVYKITDEIKALASGKGTNLATGGMVTKIQAAEICMDAGIPMVIANGENPDNIYGIIEGKNIGTRFAPEGK